MIYEIFYEGKGKDKRKLARPVKDRQALMALRNSTQNLNLLAKAREGDSKAKAKLLQLAYNLGHVDGLLAGCRSIGSFFFHDVDLYEESGNREALATEGTQEGEYSASSSSEEIKNLILSKKDEVGLVMLERSVSGGYHLVCKRVPGTTILENQVRVACELKLEMDTSAHDLQRVVYSTSGSAEDLIYLDDCIFEEPMSPEECEAEYQLLKERERKNLEEVPKEAKKANKHYRPWEDDTKGSGTSVPYAAAQKCQTPLCVGSPQSYPSAYHGIPFTEILKKYWEVNNRGFEPTEGDRDTLTYQLACDLRHICGKNAEWLDQVIPCYDGFTPEEKRQKIQSALSSDLEAFPTRLRNVLNELQMSDGRCQMEDVDQISEEDEQLLSVNTQLATRKMPQGIKESIDAAGPLLAMPVLTAICPCIGALATGVELDVHGQKKGLNLIAYIAGDFASGKGKIDPVIEAWMGEVMALDKMYETQEDEWRAKKRAAKNKKEQPEEPKLPVRFLTLNNTVANLAERLANTEGKHAFSFTPEADTVAQKWKSTVSDFSVMLRQSYDGSRYDREARSAEAVNVHIEHLLWDVVMCGTPDALYRVVNNYTDGFQSRIAVARTPDNTFAKLEEKPYVLTPKQTERIQQIAHLLPLMQGDVVLPKLEARGREWLEKIRLETMMNDDRVKARQRFRVCVTAQRMTCCVMLCKVCESLIQKHGLNAAESLLKQKPNLWKEQLQKAQTLQILEVYDVIADSLIENALFFFRDRIENAFRSRDYAGGIYGERLRHSKNDSIYARLDPQFTEDQAMQHTVAVKGAGVTHNSVRQMLKNWRKQGLIEQIEKQKFRKL